MSAKEVLYCETSMNEIKVSFQWTIDRFGRHRQKSGEYLESVSFGATEDPKNRWFLSLYPDGHTEQEVGWLSVSLSHVSVGANEVIADFSVSIINGKQLKIKERHYRDRLFNNTGLGFTKFIARSELLDPKNDYLIDDRLTIRCEVTYDEKVETIAKQLSAIEANKTNSMVEDMASLYSTKKGFDVVLEVNGREFTAHKLILKARSLVFDAMFDHSMKENNDNRVIIEDLSENVFERVLEFIYTDDIARKDTDYMGLLSAADKYDLQKLKQICGQEIASKLTVGTVSEVLLLADMHSAQELKDKANQFIKSNAMQVMNTNGWKSVAKNADLLAECFRNYVQNIGDNEVALADEVEEWDHHPIAYME